MSSPKTLNEILVDIDKLISNVNPIRPNDFVRMNTEINDLISNLEFYAKQHNDLTECIKRILPQDTTTVRSQQEYINILVGIRKCVWDELNPSGESSGFAGSQESSVAGSTVSAIAEPTRVFNMLNSIEHCKVENAKHILTSLEVKLYDGRHALIQTFMNLFSPTASSGAKTNPLSIASHPGVSASRSIDRKDAIQVMDAIQVDEIMQGSHNMKQIEITIDTQRINDSSRRTRAAKTIALERFNRDKPRVALAVNLNKEETEKLNAAQAAQAGQARQAGQAQAVTSKEPPLDMFDDMMKPVNKLKLLEFATYIAAKSEPCQVHDRTECDYAEMLRKYRNDGDANRVYTEMLQNEWLIDKTQMERVQKLHKDLKTHFESVKPATSSAKNVGQQACRDCAVLMFKTYKEHANTTSSSHVPAAEVVLEMPYSVYREIKNDATQQEENDITTALQGNDGPRGFDATSSWGNNLVNWYWAMGSCDAAVQAFDHKHNYFAFQYTKCVFDDPRNPAPPRIQSKFTVVDRRGSPIRHQDIDCIPLQFGHKTVECVFNPNLDSKIGSVMETPIRTLENPPFLCTYMPEVTLNHFSEQEDSNGPDGKGKGKGNVKGKSKSKTIPHWKDLHDGFISKCKDVFGTSGATFFRSDIDQPRTIGDAIPDKITHMGITWVLTAVSQGPVSLDATLDKIRLACDTVEPRNRGCTKEARWVVLSDMFVESEAVGECAKYIGFTCGSSAKERGDAGKYWDMFWTQKYLKTPCSFWSGDYLAVAATTAPGLAWGIVVNSTVTVWGAEGQRPTIDAHELEKIQTFVRGARSKGGEAYAFFISRIKMLLEYLAFTFIRKIISLIRAPPSSVGAAREQHVALDTILILCAALSSITSSVELITDTAGNFTPAVVINNDCLTITEALFNDLVPTNVVNVNEGFCDQHGIYDRESYFRKLIPLTGLNDALNKHSGLLWAYDYISAYNSDEKLSTTDLFQIYKIHQPPERTGKRYRFKDKRLILKLEKTFASVDVLCISKMVRDTTSKRGADDQQYNIWLQQLCTGKLDEFLKVNQCRDIFCEFVRFNMPHRLGGGVNRLCAYLGGPLFPAPGFCERVVTTSSSTSPPRHSSQRHLPTSVKKPPKAAEDDSQHSFGVPSSQSSQPCILESVSQTCQSLTDTTNPEQFVRDIQNADACTHQPETGSPGPSKKKSQEGSPPPFLSVAAGSGAYVAEGSFGVGAHAVQHASMEDAHDDPENICSRFLVFLENKRDLSNYDMIETVTNYIRVNYGCDLNKLVGNLSEESLDENEIKELKSLIRRFNSQDKSKGGSTHTSRSRRRRNHRRTQYTNKHKRSSKTTNRATIKRSKSYRKHNRTIKHRNTRRRK